MNSIQSTEKDATIRTLIHYPGCRNSSRNAIRNRGPSIPMNSELYAAYLDYLSNLTFAETIIETDRQLIQKTAINYFIRNYVLYRRHRGKERLVVPEHKKKMLLQASHDHQLSGHMGVDNTYQRLSDKYYWKEMYEDIRQYIRTCDICQKRRRDKDIDRLKPIQPTTLFEHIGRNS